MTREQKERFQSLRQKNMDDLTPCEKEEYIKLVEDGISTSPTQCMLLETYSLLNE